MTSTLSLDKTPDGWSDVAAAYDGMVTPFLSQFATDLLTFTDLQPGESVLDVAAGTGALSLQAAKRGGDVLATDFAPAMLGRLQERAQEHQVDIKTACMDGQALELPDDRFDAAFSNFGLIFFPDRDRGFQEMARVVRPGGRVGVTGWSAPENVAFFRVLQAGIQEVAPDLPPPPEPPAAFSLADPDRVQNEMQGAGLQDVQVRQETHAWQAETPARFWEAMTTTNPVMPPMMERVGPERADALREVVVQMVEDEHGKGPVQMLAQANVAIARV